MKTIFCIAALVSAAWCLPTDPTPALDHLAKRTDPPLLAFRTDDPDAVTKRDALQAAFRDVYQLAATAIDRVDSLRDIYKKYFPEDWIPEVIKAYQRIVPGQVSTLDSFPFFSGCGSSKFHFLDCSSTN